MTEIAKWAWIFLFIILFFGAWVFAILAADVVLWILIKWLKPEWVERM